MSENIMTDEELDAHFRGLVDMFIDQANDLADHSNRENIGLALLHAASRYNAFVVSAHASGLSEYEKNIKGARTFFLSQYEEMLDQNFADYKKLFQENGTKPQ